MRRMEHEQLEEAMVNSLLAGALFMKNSHFNIEFYLSLVYTRQDYIH
jgi:hypothetical protein